MFAKSRIREPQHDGSINWRFQVTVLLFSPESLYHIYLHHTLSPARNIDIFIVAV